MPTRSASWRLCGRNTQFTLRGWWLFLRSTSSVYHAGSISTLRTRPATSSTSVPRTVKSRVRSPSPSSSTTTLTKVVRPLSPWSRIVIRATFSLVGHPGHGVVGIAVGGQHLLAGAAHARPVLLQVGEELPGVREPVAVPAGILAQGFVEGVLAHLGGELAHGEGALVVDHRRQPVLVLVVDVACHREVEAALRSAWNRVTSRSRKLR